MAAEVEVKIAVPAAGVARRRIRAVGFEVHAPRVFEVNTVWDTPAQEFRNSGRLIRLRQAGKSSTLTFKGRATDTIHKIREEIETTVARPEAMQRILTEIGLRPAFRYEKYRTEFSDGSPRGVVTLDETPIGTFLEIEGPARWIDRTARKLGFTTADYITLSYGALYFAWCREHDVEPSNMTF